MADALPDVDIPDRPTFKAAEVCELLKIQAYVLRSWENEFADLGVARTPGAPRVYRRSDVEMAVRIRQLVFGEGLTLAGVRRRFEQERPAPPDDDLVAVGPSPADPRRRERLEQVRQGLRSVLAMLDSRPGAAGATPPAAPARKTPAAKPLPSRTPDASLFAESETAATVEAVGGRRPGRRKP